MIARRTIRVSAWPAFSNKGSNPYQFNLYTHMADGAHVQELSLKLNSVVRALHDRPDVVHIHWLDKVLWNTSARLASWNMIKLAVMLRCLSAFGTKVVWTVHDPSLHAISANAFLHTRLGRLLYSFYSNQVICSISGLIFLSREHVEGIQQSFPRFRRLPYAVMPHPHYVGSYPNQVSRGEARGALGIEQRVPLITFVGQIRPYKNVESLISAFREYAEPKARLLIAGKPDSPAYEENLRAMLKGDSRITIEAKFIPDDRLQYFINAADVLVLPFSKATNSGSVALAMSFSRPTAVPDIPVFREVQEIVGREWLYLFKGELNPTEIAKILDWAASTTRPSQPNLDPLSWEAAAKNTLRFYEKIVLAK